MGAISKHIIYYLLDSLASSVLNMLPCSEEWPCYKTMKRILTTEILGKHLFPFEKQTEMKEEVNVSLQFEERVF